MNSEDIFEHAKDAVKRSGEIVTRYFKTKNIDVSMKNNQTLVTIADIESSISLCNMLYDINPEFGILIEEDLTNYSNRLHSDKIIDNIQNYRDKEYFWIIDPLDGTKAFVNQSTNFGICVGLVKDDNIKLGINYFPIKKAMYYSKQSEGVSIKETPNNKKELKTSSADNFKAARLVTSLVTNYGEIQKFVEEQLVLEPIQVASLSMKISLVAEAAGDFIINYSTKSSLWDVCSSEIIIGNAGGKLTDMQGNRIDYRRDTLNLYTGTLVSNSNLHGKLLEAIKKYEVQLD
jgi:3'-phosphoadenosine 5'-phosphosulfate (PAPS) 3'-phosphatase